MAINKRNPHIYDAEYIGPSGIRELSLFARSNSVSVTYTDANNAVVSRRKGFEDTNLTEDGRINEADMVLTGIGVRIVPGPAPNTIQHAQDVYAFLERGYADLYVDDNTTCFTARIRDLVPASRVIGSGAIESDTGATALGIITLTNEGRGYPVQGIKIPRGVKFRLDLRWDRPLALPSNLTARVEAEIWSVNPDYAQAHMTHGGVLVPGNPMALPGPMPAGMMPAR